MSGPSKTPIHVGEPPSTSSKVTLNKPAFDDIVWKQGYKIYVDKAIKCPCQVKNVNQPTPSCKNCGGVGWVFLNRYITRALMTSMNKDTKYKDWTKDRLGMANVTVQSNVSLCNMDKITLLESSIITNQIIFPSFVGTILQARLIYDFVIEVEEIFAYLDEGVKLQKLTEGVEFTISGNVITFDANLIKDNNATVSIRYKHRPQFYIVDMVRDVRHQSEGDNILRDQGAFPVHAIARRSHFVLDEKNLGCTELLDNSYIPDLDC